MIGGRFLISMLFVFLLVRCAGADLNRDEIQRALADSLVAAGDREAGLQEYQEILDRSPADIQTRLAVADILSWDRRYAEALRLYDEILKATPDVKIWRQKARVLGWSRAYTASLKEYAAILKVSYDRAVDLEMHAKKALWASRIEQAIGLYRQLIDLEPDNVEAAFDLAEIYAYSGLWPEAKEYYHKVLVVSPLHARAKRSLERVKVEGRVAVTTGLHLFEADSGSRDSDIRWHSFFNRFHVPVGDRFILQVDDELARRYFADRSRQNEERVRVKGLYRQASWWSADAVYDRVDYAHDFRSIDEFGSGINIKTFELMDTRWFYERERLENNSEVLSRHYYQDKYGMRAKLPIGMRWESGIDHVYARYSDSNRKYVSGGDILYRLFFDPDEVYVKCRYERQDFRRINEYYFSPGRFATRTIGALWRHSFDRGEKFFGSARNYTECGYEMSVDSEHVSSRKLSGAWVYQFRRQTFLRLEFAQTLAENDVYRDQRGVLSLRQAF